MFEHELRALVKTASGIDNTNWFGSETDVYPAVALLLISELGQHTQDGRLTTKQCVVQVDLWSRDASEALTKKNALLSVVGTYIATDDDAKLRKTMLVTMRSGIETTAPNEPLYRYSIDLRCVYTD
ncbi:hypothetical protein [Rhodobacter capsulatus]|uniref:hypothetical protein n=1 Tax=Rhodobacter capsulatus TaxID=1061 RepID=UPI00402544A7